MEPDFFILQKTAEKIEKNFPSARCTVHVALVTILCNNRVDKTYLLMHFTY